ncbi:hypothetical protein [Micromonospora sp. RV43]|uniref:hypothetical protein n=1 Tax=Micromonospora sp. RV43 TaxID=1661387 RepID=UPI00069FE6DC|nr:hypothetical protein [Micromonospora sp. RV43]
MTTTNSPTGRAVACRPPLTGPLLREVFPVPPVLRLDDVGALCPLDDVVLTRETDGWSCPACGAAWNPQGRDGWWPITTQDAELVDAGPVRAGRMARVGIVGVVAAGPAAATVALAHRYAEYADAVPQEQVFAASAATVGLVGLVLAGRRVVRWVDERRHPLAVDVDEADLDPYGRELLARVRAARQSRGEVA